MHAHRDAARAGRQALELWPDGDDEERRIEALESYAGSAELAGELADAAAAWRELCALRAERPRRWPTRRAAARRGLRPDAATARRALAARRAAADAYAAAGRPAEAAVERLAIGQLPAQRAPTTPTRSSSRAPPAARPSAAERLDLRARALGLEGVATAKRGDYEAGLETVEAGLALALEHDLTPVAAELYQRLSMVLYDSRRLPPRAGGARHRARAVPRAATSRAPSSRA